MEVTPLIPAPPYTEVLKPLKKEVSAPQYAEVPKRLKVKAPANNYGYGQNG